MRSKSHEIIKCLEHRLHLWDEGDIDALRVEGQTVQQHLYHSHCTSPADSSRIFSHLIFQGKIKAAMQFLTEQSRGSSLRLSTPVGNLLSSMNLLRNILILSPTTPMSLINPDTTTLQSCHPVIFDHLDSDLIRRTAVRIEGSTWPSGVDALGWRHLSISFQTASSDLCCSLASVARHISISFTDPDTLQRLLNCQLIALDKNLGVRPIGISENSRRIVAKAVLHVVK